MGIGSVPPIEAKRLIDEGYSYLDVRSEQEFEAGHADGAFNIPIAHAGPGGMVGNPDFVKVVRAHFPPDAKLVLGCRSGVRSMRAAEVLAAQGYSDLFNLDGGFGGSMMQRGWAAEGLPVSHTAPAGTTYAELAAKAD